MAVTANVLRVSTTLRLGERVLVRCDDGLLSTEYVLFDASDIILRAADPVSVRETGYITTVRDALARLAVTGVTPELAEEAAPLARRGLNSRLHRTSAQPSHGSSGGCAQSGTGRGSTTIAFVSDRHVGRGNQAALGQVAPPRPGSR